MQSDKTLITHYLYLFRLTALMSIMIISLSWSFGILVSTSIICFCILTIPSLAMLYNSVTNNHCLLADRSTIFLPVSPFQHLHSREKVKSRIINKVVASTMIVIILTVEFIPFRYISPLSPTYLR